MKTRKLEPDELVGQMMHELVQARLSKELLELKVKLEAVLNHLPLGTFINNHITQIDVAKNDEIRMQRDQYKTSIAPADFIRYAEQCWLTKRIPEIEREVKNEIIRRLELMPKE